MLSFLRLNNPTIIFVASILLLLGVRIASIQTPIDTSVWQLNAAPFAYLLYNAAPNLLSNIFFSYSISAFMVLLLAFSINTILNQYKILGQRDYFVAWIFVLISCMHTSFLVLNPMLISLFFIVILFKEIFNLKEDKVDFGKVFNIGFLTSLSFLFSYSNLLLIIMVFVASFMFSKISLRFFLVFFIGTLIPFIYFIFYFFWVDKLGTEFLKSFSFFKISFIQILDFFKTENLTITPIFVFATAGLFALLNKSQKVVKEIRQFSFLLILLSVIYFLAFIFQYNGSMQVVVPLLFPFSIFVALQINTFKRKMVAELAHLSLLLFVVFNVIVS
jgi:hypothetical protein